MIVKHNKVVLSAILILYVIFEFLLFFAKARLAYFNSLSEALNIKKVIRDIKNTPNVNIAGIGMYVFKHFSTTIHIQKHAAIITTVIIIFLKVIHALLVSFILSPISPSLSPTMLNPR